jgi:hypothetical protein
LKPKRVFVIQPFGAKHSRRFYRAVADACLRSKREFEAFRADKQPTTAGPRLQDRINSYIHTADMCLADLCTPRNANALLEVGAAYTLGIPVIPVSDSALPSDISGNYYIHLTPSTLSKPESAKLFREEVLQRLWEVSSGLPTASRAQHFLAYGYASRGVVDFWSLVQRCEERFDILTTNLGFVVNEELPCGMTKKMRTLLEMAIEWLPQKPERFAMRVLTLDPDSNFTNERAVALDRDRQQFRDHMRKDLETLRRFVESKECTASVQVKTYDAFPLQMTYFFDDTVVSSVVANARSSRDCITYMHSLNENGARETYERHYEKIWNTGQMYAQSTKTRPRRHVWKPGKAGAKSAKSK